MHKIKKRTILFTALLGLSLCAYSQEVIRPNTPIKDRSFAIIVDAVTFDHCKNEIIAYQQAIEKEGLPTFIVYDKWKNPDHIKQKILSLYDQSKLEGIVLLGDIPIPMIRKAQHLATAFKMDESYDIKDSSIPSDRFYDDFGLKFDYIKQDTVHQLYHYYDLAIDSDNKIKTTLYSGRIKPLKAEGKDPYEQVRLYLQKVIAAHTNSNIIDHVVAYLGDGTLSNSLAAWSPELYRLEEQFPNTFKHSTQAQVYRYDSWSYPKNEIINQLRRKDLDIIFFHEHGMPERQYISGDFKTTSNKEHLESIQHSLKKSALRNRKANKTTASFFKPYVDNYHLDSVMLTGYEHSDFIKQDSLREIMQGINLAEVDSIQPNAKLTIFDACYNGDFREDDYIAGRYIFSSGQSLVAFANTVSVLQDVNTPHLIGVLGAGVSVGRWAQMHAVLESHIIGDPTWRFTASSAKDFNKILNDHDAPALLAQFKASSIVEERNLILYRLSQLQYADLAQLLMSTYQDSPYTTTRYTCLELGIALDDQTRLLLLQKAINDSDEFIRRHAINTMGQVGDPILVNSLVQAYIDNQHASRILFAIKHALYAFDHTSIKKAADSLFAVAPFINSNIKKEDFLTDQLQGYYANVDKDIFNKDGKYRKLGVSSLKNMNYHPSIASYIDLAQDSTEKESLRIAMLQSLAWFGYSYHKALIQKACQDMINTTTYSSALREEAQRTLNTLR